jgi:hypothetical protein
MGGHGKRKSMTADREKITMAAPDGEEYDEFEAGAYTRPLSGSTFSVG